MSLSDNYFKMRYAVWTAISNAGFDATESQQDEIEDAAENWTKAGFVHWLHDYTDGKVSEEDAFKICDLINGNDSSC